MEYNKVIRKDSIDAIQWNNSEDLEPLKKFVNVNGHEHTINRVDDDTIQIYRFLDSSKFYLQDGTWVILHPRFGIEVLGEREFNETYRLV